MRFWPVSAAAVMLVALAIPAVAISAVSAGVSITDEGLSGFYLAVGDYYEVPQERVVFVRNQHVPDEELPVVFFLAERAHVGPDVLVRLRLGGMSWMEISLKYGITAEAFYVPVAKTPGPPYGKAYGHYKNHEKSKWNEIRLSDPDIVNFVNLKFVSGHYRCTPDEVIQARGAGKSFVNISTEIEKKRTVSEAPSEDKAKSGKGNSSGKTKK